MKIFLPLGLAHLLATSLAVAFGGPGHDALILAQLAAGLIETGLGLAGLADRDGSW